MENFNEQFVKSELTSPVKVGAIYTVHYFRYGKNFRFEKERHNFWELVFIDSGNATILDNETFLPLKQGEAFIHKPNEYHTIYTNEDFANSAIITFECKSRALRSIANNILHFNDYEKNLLNKIISETKSGYEDKLNDVHLKKMTRKKQPPFACDQIIKNCIELLLISLIRDTQTMQTTEEMSLNMSSDKIVDGIITILNDKLENSENVNLDEISYKLGFSKSYIKSQFKKKTGFSIIQFYINIKIDKAKKLLSQQKYTVSEIADMLGFGSVYYFSRQFKTHTDMSPTEYMNSIKADNVL